MTYPVRGFQNDSEFLGYCSIHCDTPRALFSGEQIKQAHILAGLPAPDIGADEWYSMHEEMQALVEAAQKRLDS